RAARLGDAWYPVPDDQALPLDSFPRMQAGINKLREYTEAAGRPAESVAIALRMHKYGHQIAPQASDGERQLFSGSTDEIVSDLERLRDLGLSAVDFRFTEETPDKVLAAMASFQKNVLAKFKR